MKKENKIMDFGSQFNAENNKNKAIVVAISGEESDLKKMTELSQKNAIPLSGALGRVIEQIVANERIIDNFLFKQNELSDENILSPSGLRLYVGGDTRSNKRQKTISLKSVFHDDVKKVKSMLKNRQLKFGTILGGLLLEYLVAYDEVNKKKVGNEE